MGERGARRIALLILGLFLIGEARAALAIEVPLPGERRMGIHGFYEMRLRTFGKNLPANGATLSQFRHVLNLETDIELAPEGLGPFDAVYAFSRWIVSYECIYERACGLFPAADSFGGAEREAVRMPRNFNKARTDPPYVAGLFPQRWFPGTNQSTRQVVNPGRRYRPCRNADDDFVNPSPIAFVCNTDGRSILDEPLAITGLNDQRAGVATADFRQRGGVVNARFGATVLGLSRGLFGKDRTRALSRLPRVHSNLFGTDCAANPNLFGCRTLPGEEARAFAQAFGVVRALDGSAARAGSTRFLPGQMTDRGQRGTLAAVTDAASGATRDLDADALIAGTWEEDLPRNGRQGIYLAARLDPDRFGDATNRPDAEGLAIFNRTGLTESVWAQTRFRDTSPAWNADIDQPLRPWGYLTVEAFDWFSEFAPAQTYDFRWVVGQSRLTAEEIGEPQPVAGRRNDNFQIAAFTGADGIEFTADDLPMCNDATCSGQIVTYTEADGVTQRSKKLFQLVKGAAFGFKEATGPNDPQLASASDCRNEFLQNGNRTDRKFGVNAEGLCVKLLFKEPGQGANDFVTPEGAVALIDAFADPNRRPVGARLEPTDLTDLDARRRAQISIPGRPSNPSPGLWYYTAGAIKLADDEHGLVTSLDADFREDELRWEHGSGQDEHEFKEGYVEFEMLNSSLFARLGKLLVVWGKTELFRNQDQFNPVDSGFGTFSTLEESRLGQWAAQFIYAPEWMMSLGPFEGLRVELAVLYDDFEPTDLGKCGESLAFVLTCGVTSGTITSGLYGLGLLGAVSPYTEYTGLERLEWGIRIEGQYDRYAFSISDFWGWDDTFYLDVVTEYGRKVDAVTGAPTNAFGSSVCRWRDASGAPTADRSLSVGPDGQAGTGDEGVPSVGNCLLFDNPAGAARQQVLRSSADIANNHTVNQTLFHLFCTLTYDEDSGFCAFDTLTSPQVFQLGPAIFLGGQFAAVITPDFKTFLTNDHPYRGTDIERFMLVKTTSGNVSAVVTFEDQLTQQQMALLGCGLSFASPCDVGPQAGDTLGSVNHISSTTALKKAFRVPTSNPNDPNSDVVALFTGGIDFMNADASVITQEFTVLKALAGSTVIPPTGTMRTIEDRDGDGVKDVVDVSQAALYFPGEAQQANPGGGTLVEGALVGSTLRTDPNAQRKVVNGVEYSFLPGICLEPDASNKCRASGTQGGNTTDFQVEGMPWLADPRLMAQGVMIFMADANDPLKGRGTATTADDGSNVFNPRGELCSAALAGRQGLQSCTPLEVVSANLERILMSSEMAGNDDLFDAPETLAELLAMIDGDESNDAFGDPISGPDGIFFSNFDGRTVDGNLMFFDPNAATPTPTHFVDPNADLPVRNFGVAKQTAKIAITPDKIDNTLDELAIQLASNSINSQGVPRVRGHSQTAIIPANGCPDQAFAGGLSDQFCYHEFAKAGTPILADQKPAESADDGPLIAALPVRASIQYRPVGGGAWQDLYIDPRSFSPSEIQALVNAQRIQIDASNLRGDSTQVGGLAGLLEVRDHATRGSRLNRMLILDNDGDRVADLDQDGDGVFDWVDDGTPGPISDDNPLCGAGIPGDVLQTTLQFDFADGTLVNGVPNGRGNDTWFNTLEGVDADGNPVKLELAPRNPFGCSNAILGATGQTLPFRRAGGSGGFGRRDFLWHGGQQLVGRYQKRNTLGFSLDFAEDTTKSSWGIEFSWASGRLFGNSLSRDGLNASDNLVLTVSIDRPTFINFLNPNRTFFVNLQFFVRYLSDYVGGRDSKDGMYGTAAGPFSGSASFTVFTGYFQDKLNPRFTFVWFPDMSQYGFITGLGYRWNENFTANIGFNHFFGHPNQAQAAYFPPALRAAPDQTSETFRGTAAARNRDVAIFTLRWTF